MAEPIWRRRRQIEKRQRDEIAAATVDIRARYSAELRALREECEHTGHWRFTHVGIFARLLWYACGSCGATKCEDTSKSE